jgi:pSer/pThr/pTyr-binding forkhead associated (FHA) protein
MRTTTTNPNETTNNPTILERSTMWLTITTDDGAAPRIQHVATDEFVIGRELTADLVIDDEKASRQQCRLTRQENGDLELLDLGSTNGTRVNGMRASGPVVLHGGEQIRIGRHTILVSRTDPSAVGGTLIDTTEPASLPRSPRRNRRLLRQPHLASLSVRYRAIPSQPRSRRTRRLSAA